VVTRDSEESHTEHLRNTISLIEPYRVQRIQPKHCNDFGIRNYC